MNCSKLTNSESSAKVYLTHPNTQKGITLVALIITIIVLLILAIVSIKLVMNGGIIDRAERGTFAYSEAETKEKIATAYSEYQMSKYQSGITFRQALLNSGINVAEEDIIGSDSEGYIVTYNRKDYPVSATGSVGNGIEQWKQNQDGSISKGETTGIQVGDIVHYEAILNQTANAVDNAKLSQLRTDLQNYSGDSSSTDNSSIARDDLTWKVLDVKDDKIRLISANPTTKTIKLYGANGYNNAVYLIDEACSTLYSSNKGTAQNLKIEDIEEKLSDKGKNSKDNYVNSNVDTGKYGGTKEYTSNLKYPNIYVNEVGCKAVAAEDNTGNILGKSNQTNLINGSSTATVRLKTTQTFWEISMMSSNDFVNSKYYALFIKNSTNYSAYYLSSRYVHCNPDRVGFGLHTVADGKVGSKPFFASNNWSGEGLLVYRPVITLNSNISLIGDSTNGWTIK